MQNFRDDVVFVAGGDTRQESMKNALKHIDTEYVMVSDVARCCIPPNMIQKIAEAKTKADCIVPYLNASDTVVYEDETIDRDNVKLIQTPQLSRREVLQKALESSVTFTDDSSAIKSIGGSVFYIEGAPEAKKLTFQNELKSLTCLESPSSDSFCGSGFDVHAFEDGKKMFLGGNEIDVPYGFKAHSDGDVLIHSLIDSILGACGGGDIGEFFPDTDEQYKGADSKELLKQIVLFVQNVGYEIVNVDVTVIAQKPKVNPYKNEIRKTIADLLQIEKAFVNIKATTTERLGFTGRCEGVAVMSSATLKYYDWTKFKGYSK